MNRYTIIIEKGVGNYSAYCPDLPGVVAAGETEEETVELMIKAIDPLGRLEERETSHPRADSHCQNHKSDVLAAA